MVKRRYLTLPWQEWYSLAYRYNKKYHHLLIPCEYETKDGYKLGKWLERQRKLYNTHSHLMTDQKKESLERISMVWSLEHRYKWEQWFALCNEYHLQYGHLNVETKCIYKEMALGEWICQQRKKHAHGDLDDKKQKALESLDMQWSTRKRQSWESWYAIAKQYYDQNGNIDVKVHYIDERGNKLGLWMYTQREKYRGKRCPYLKEEQINQLNALSIKW